MSKTKIAIMDDSQPKAEAKSQKAKVKNEEKLEATEVKSPVILSPSTLLGVNSSEGSLPAMPARQAGQDLKSTDSSALPQNDKNDKPKKAQKPGKQKKYRSKKYTEAVKELDKSKSYPLNEAVELVKKGSYSKFTGTFEAHLNTNITGIRGLVTLPFSSGKKLRILAFGTGAENSSADILGNEAKIDEINKGKIDFDLVITTPQWMSKLAKVAKNLGPRGLMPSPKNGTIVDDLKKAVESFQAGKTEYKNEAKAKVIHIALGKLSQPSEELSANLKVLVNTIGKTKIKKIALSPTMGPSVKLDLSSI